MRSLQRTSILVFVILGVVTPCGLPSITFNNPISQATMQALTVDAAVRASQQPPGPGTASPSPTVSLIASHTAWPTFTPTASQTPTLIPSVTPLVPMISVSVPTNCRKGPGKIYPSVGALLVGQVAQVYARDPSGHYWYIRLPDAPSKFCWVWDGYATLYGVTALLPIYTPPPRPAPTATPTSETGFSASYDGLVKCKNSWWAEIALENTGSLSFNSIKIVLRDMHLGVSVSAQANDFVDRPNCTSKISRTSLQPGKTLIISSPSVDSNPTGHKVRAQITLCTKTDLDGKCVTRTITFRP